MSAPETRAILRDSRALIVASDALRVVTPWAEGENTEVELHLRREDYRDLLRQAPGEIRDFLEWLVSLDDPDPESEGFQARRVTTMSDIVRRARTVLGKEE